MPRPLSDGRSCGRHQESADATTLLVVTDVEVVDQRSPLRVVVADRVHESEQLVAMFGDERDIRTRRSGEPRRPNLVPVRLNVTVEVSLGKRAAIVATPAVRMELADCFCITRSRWTKSECIRHVAPHRFWRWHAPRSRMPDPHSARSLRVTLNESVAPYESVSGQLSDRE